ncbi:FkbM family methyltransferase [Herbaspirillum sp. alder98]|uniref:FkbM family methyltransferase n=1 Tax=Herbaspirillum sp. alder98 TaxID=2913096 RepID=UPI001CD85A5E|nr:FkbM family methyltransferase [Herbaspirillum sp. alder98]MCA1326249.1 FkbM family methyltransferase [Herbaspirillum sp. alder98]
MDILNTWKWHSGLTDVMRFPFDGARGIVRNHSQAWQDLFVLSMLDGRTDGRFLEVGANVASAHSNTCLLDTHFGWKGISLEFDPACLQSWIEERPGSEFVLADALTLDYARALPEWFGTETRIDYLQLDIDPSFNTLQALKRLPLDTYRFSVITFETDAYSGDFRARDESRQILQRHGYQLVAPNLCVLYELASPEPIPFEDWWVDPQVVDPRKIDELNSLRHNVLLPQNVLFRV